MNVNRSDYDSPWKTALERYFEDFMALFFPKAHAGIDWSQGYTFLDKELQQVVRDAELGRRLADKLVKVWCNDGEERWVLIHVEVQSQVERNFARRMYTYNYRLFDRYDRQVASLAVLGDELPNWQPQHFGYELWGCEVGFKFPIVKLLDYQQQWEMLEGIRNPFAIVVMAHLKMQETRHDAEARKQWKFSLVRRLYEKGYQREQIIDLFKFIDWLMQLPEELELTFWQTLRAYEEETKMTYVTSVERIGYQRGVKEGREEGAVQTMQEAVLKILEVRFGTPPINVVTTLAEIQDLSYLKELLEQAATMVSLAEFKTLLT